MGFLKRFFRGSASVQQLPTGTITVDRHGQIVTSTVASAYPKNLLLDIAADILSLFRDAREAELPMAEISMHFGSLHITARELRGGALIFLFPQTALPATLKPARS